MSFDLGALTSKLTIDLQPYLQGLAEAVVGHMETRCGDLLAALRTTLQAELAQAVARGHGVEAVLAALQAFLEA
jgi:hypothetical protein